MSAFGGQIHGQNIKVISVPFIEVSQTGTYKK